MMPLPQGWAMASLAAQAGPNGIVSDGDWVETKDQDPQGEVRLTQLADIGDGVFLDRSQRFMNTQTVSRLGCTLLREGDLLIARMPDPLGRAAIYPGLPQPAVTVVDVLVWRGGGISSDSRCLMHFINSPDIRRHIASEASGTTRQRIAGGKLKTLSLPVPPLAEQKRIVAKVDGLTARTARARAELDRIPALVTAFRMAALRNAFCVDNDNKARWPTSTVGEIGDVALGRQRSPKDHEGPQMRPYVRAGNITWTGWDLSDVKSMNFDDAEFLRFSLRDGDVLVNEGSGSAREVGKPAIWRGQIAECCFQNTLLRVRPERCTAEYLYWYLRFAALSELLVSSTQGVNIYHIGKAGLSNLSIPVPPKAEQDEIVSRIEATFAWLSRVEAEIERATDTVPKLDQAILAKAFRGELVPQDPADEPASVLLDRIRAERAAAPTRKRKARA